MKMQLGKSILYKKNLKCNKEGPTHKISSCFYHYKITVHSRHIEQWKMTGSPELHLVLLHHCKVPYEICSTQPGPLAAHGEVHQQ